MLKQMSATSRACCQSSIVLHRINIRAHARIGKFRQFERPAPLTVYHRKILHCLKYFRDSTDFKSVFGILFSDFYRAFRALERGAQRPVQRVKGRKGRKFPLISRNWRTGLKTNSSAAFTCQIAARVLNRPVTVPITVVMRPTPPKANAIIVIVLAVLLACSPPISLPMAKASFALLA